MGGHRFRKQQTSFCPSARPRPVILSISFLSFRALPPRPRGRPPPQRRPGDTIRAEMCLVGTGMGFGDTIRARLCLLRAGRGLPDTIRVEMCLLGAGRKGKECRACGECWGRATWALFARRWNSVDYEKDLCDLHKSVLLGSDNQCFMIYALRVRVGDGGGILCCLKPFAVFDSSSLPLRCACGPSHSCGRGRPQVSGIHSISPPPRVPLKRKGLRRGCQIPSLRSFCGGGIRGRRRRGCGGLRRGLPRRRSGPRARPRGRRG